MDIKDATIQELEEALAERRAQPPAMLEKTNWEPVRAACQSVCVSMRNEESCEDEEDRQQWVYDAAMEAVYGRDIWSWMDAVGDE